MLKLQLNSEINLILKATTDNNNSGQDSIEKYIQKEILDSIKLSNDNEVEFFKPAINFNLRPYFNDSNSYLNADFKTVDFSGSNEYTNESFYFFDIYDTPDKLNQTLLYRNFVTLDKVNISGITPIIEFKINSVIPEYMYINIPSYITANTVYLNIFFFNSRNGKLRYFESGNNDDIKKYFLEILLNRVNKTYTINNPIILDSNNFRINEIIELEKENNTNENNQPIISFLQKTKKTITTKGIFI
jgi:hypothetical protein